MQAGEQPLRDFLDAGLQGARPSLTYELSAAAQTYLGNNLRSEAWLTVGGVALGAAMTFIAGSIIAPWPWALATALLSALISPKLYGYPKVLITAVASLLIVNASRLPVWPRLALMSVWTAIAFLFRHDYAIYCVAGFVVLTVCAARTSWRDRLTHAAAYMVLTGVLLAPSLWWVQHYRGLTEYLRNGLEMSRAEANRTEIGWPRLTLDGALWSVVDNDENAEAWVYYLILAIPVVVVGVTARTVVRDGWDQHAPVPALLALSAMTTVLSYFLLRGNLAARFGDMAPPVAVLAAYLLFVSTRQLVADWRRALIGAGIAMAVLAITVQCTWQLASVRGELRSARLLEPADVFARTRQASQDLQAMPAALLEAEGAGRMQASAYLHQCTKPTDRVLVMGYAPDVIAFAERLFGGKRASFVPGFYADERYSKATMAALDSTSVPIVLAGALLGDGQMPLIDEYFRSHYDEAGKVRFYESEMRVLVRRGLTGQPLGPGGLPCFG